MKKVEVVQWQFNDPPIIVNYYTKILDPEKCAKYALSVIQAAVSDKNKRIKVDDSINLQNAKEQIILLEACGCKIKIVDVE